MKGQVCSWQDMRRIQAILGAPEKFKGQYEALMRCGKRTTQIDWENAIRVMSICRISDTSYVKPSHASVIASLAEENTWADWVQRCEIDQLTVVELRQALRRARSRPAQIKETGSAVTDLIALINDGQTFGTIYADPPWLYDNQGTRAATGNHYTGLTVDALCDLPVGKLAAPDAHLHMWTTNGFLFEAPRIFASWGFEFRSTFVWVKRQMGIGNYWRNSHEILLTAIRGDAKRFKVRNLKSWLECGRGRHSSKPDQVADMLERASPGPRVELFGRRRRPGWVVWGDQVEEF